MKPIEYRKFSDENLAMEFLREYARLQRQKLQRLNSAKRTMQNDDEMQNEVQDMELKHEKDMREAAEAAPELFVSFSAPDSHQLQTPTPTITTPVTQKKRLGILTNTAEEPVTELDHAVSKIGTEVDRYWGKERENMKQMTDLELVARAFAAVRQNDWDLNQEMNAELHRRRQVNENKQRVDRQSQGRNRRTAELRERQRKCAKYIE